MAFKQIKQYNEEKYGDMFVLRNNHDKADVVFLYRDASDVLVADAHYINTSTYSGYVHCTGTPNCPACKKGVRIQTKLFIPLYNIAEDAIQFWDRTMKFEPQLQSDVFNNYPNPADYVFQVVRNGEAGDINTRYEITAKAQNTYKPYDVILASKNISFPDGYSAICREMSEFEMDRALNAHQSAPTNGYTPQSNYTPVPRAAATVPTPSQYVPEAAPAPSVDSSSVEAPVDVTADSDDFGEDPQF